MPVIQCWSAVEKRKIRSAAHDCTEAVIAAFMGGVVTRLTENHAIIQGCGSAELDVLDMVSLGAFAIFVACRGSVPKTEYPGSATRASVLLAQ